MKTSHSVKKNLSDLEIAIFLAKITRIGKSNKGRRNNKPYFSSMFHAQKSMKTYTKKFNTSKKLQMNFMIIGNNKFSIR